MHFNKNKFKTIFFVTREKDKKINKRRKKNSGKRETSVSYRQLKKHQGLDWVGFLGKFCDPTRTISSHDFQKKMIDRKMKKL